ncbi:hypothetical protein [Rhizohabitans arisaemae]|uniref:hypothetical protein n=1 Tax=Rhizohabitans arisaemae TaxID=2720610 RepID=UPI0024B05FC5|nr:hypothetical protein [Rhizohabitans arisaemae]
MKRARQRFATGLVVGLIAGVSLLGLAAPAAAGSQEIKVTLTPAKTLSGAGQDIKITAECPKTGDTQVRALATSSLAFEPVNLEPDAENPLVVSGVAELSKNLVPGTYTVNVTCESNHTGEAELEILGTVPTKAPKAGGGGTAAGVADNDDEGAPTLGVVLVAGLLVGAAVFLLRRRGLR